MNNSTNGRPVWKYVLAVVALLVAVHGLASIVMGRKVAAKLAEIKAKGEYTSCAELARKPVPDPQNAALAYEAVFAGLTGFSAQGSACDAVMDPAKRAEDPALWEKAQAEIAGRAGVFPVVDQAQSMPECRFNIRWEDGFAAEFPHYGKLRQLAILLAADALTKAHKHDAAGAARSLDRLFRLQEPIKDEPVLIGILVRSAIIGIGQSALAQFLDITPMPEKEAKALADRLASMSVVSDLPRVMRGERVMMLQIFDDIREGGLDLLSQSGSRASGMEVVRMRLHTSVLGRPGFYADELQVLSVWDEILGSCDRPYREGAPAAWKRVDKLSEEAGPIGRILCPVFSRAHASVEAADVKIQGSRIALALNTHKARHGSYPATLAQLRSSVKWTPDCKDAFSGKEFIYTRSGKGFVLYSIGPNLKDDGGLPPPFTKQGSSNSDADDIVWKMDH